MHRNRIGAPISSMRSLAYRFLLLGTILGSMNSQADTLQVGIPTQTNLPATDNRHYYRRLLVLALEKTRVSHGDFTITHNSNDAGPERERAMLISNAGLQVIWGSVTQERESAMRVVPIDLVKNLNTYRLLIIKNNNQAQFDKINSLTELRKLKAGGGINWSKNAIFSANDIKVTTSGSFSGLYKMLAAGRFDYVPRAPYEVTQEIAEFGHYGVSLENQLLVKFSEPQHYSFFVRKNNQALADRIEQGLKVAQADGSFDALFAAYPNLKNGMELLKQPHRITIELNVHKTNPSP